MKNIKQTAIKAVKEAGKILIKYYGNVEVKTKDNYYDVGSIVTEADKKFEKKIVEIIKLNFPDHGIYGEEGTREKLKKDYIWYIDPLDGTLNFHPSQRDGIFHACQTIFFLEHSHPAQRK